MTIQSAPWGGTTGDAAGGFTVELTPEHLEAIARTIIDAGLARLVAAEVLSHLGTMLLEIADAEGICVSTVA